MNFAEACREIIINGKEYINEVGSRIYLVLGKTWFDYEIRPGIRVQETTISGNHIGQRFRGDFCEAVDWSKVAVDTKMIRKGMNGETHKCYFAEYAEYAGKLHIKWFRDGQTSFSSTGFVDTCYAERCRLAEEGE